MYSNNSAIYVSGVRTLSTLEGGGANFVVKMYSFFLTTQLESDNRKKRTMTWWLRDN